MNMPNSSRCRPAAIDRRQLLALLAGAAAPGLSGKSRAQAPGGPGAAEPPPGDSRASNISANLQKLTDNVYAYIQLAAPGQSGRSVSNGGLIVGPTSMLAVDTLAAPLQAQAFIEAAKKATGKSFKRVVLTHHHFDHVMGLQYFGDVDVIAQEQCRALMVASDATKPVLGLWSAHVGWAKGDESFRKVLPNITYRDQMTLYDFGDTEVRLLHLNRGHTAGDTMVYLPKEKILFAGDVAFFSITPMSASGYFADWMKVIDAVLAMDVERIVPGHGPVGSKQDLADMRGYLDTLYTQGKKLFDAGVPAAEAAKKIELGKYSSWPEAELRTRINTLRLFMEFEGTIKP